MLMRARYTIPSMISIWNIRNQSNKLCREHNLSAINPKKQKEISKIKRRNFVNWYDQSEDKKDSSYKTRLQFDIDRTIKQSINWQDVLSKMELYGYKIKIGEHMAFISKNQQRLSRVNVIGTNYTEERIKERMLNKDKEIDNIIEIKDNDKGSQAKDMNIGKQNVILKQQLQHLLKLEIRYLIRLKNQKEHLVEHQLKKLS